MLKDLDKSHFHKVGSDEIWMFHQGEPLEILMITDDGNIKTRMLGNRLDLNEEPQITVEANVWVAARIKDGKGFTLVSCVVAPGFDFEDFELANKNELMKLFPNIKNEIEELCLKYKFEDVSYKLSANCIEKINSIHLTITFKS